MDSPLPTIQTNHTTTELYDEVDSTYAEMRYPHSPQHLVTVENTSRASDTLPRKRDLECEYVELQSRLHTHVRQEPCDTNTDTFPRKVDLSLQGHHHGYDDASDGLVLTTQRNDAYKLRPQRKFSLPLHLTPPTHTWNRYQSSVMGSLTLTNLGAAASLTPNDPELSLTLNDPNFSLTVSDSGLPPINDAEINPLSAAELTPTDPAEALYYDDVFVPSNDPKLTPCALADPELTPCALADPELTHCALADPELTPYDPNNRELTPSPLTDTNTVCVHQSPSGTDPIYANVHVLADSGDSTDTTESLKNRVKTLVYQFENQLVAQEREHSEEEREIGQ